MFDYCSCTFGVLYTQCWTLCVHEMERRKRYRDTARPRRLVTPIYYIKVNSISHNSKVRNCISEVLLCMVCVIFCATAGVIQLKYAPLWMQQIHIVTGEYLLKPMSFSSFHSEAQRVCLSFVLFFLHQQLNHSRRKSCRVFLFGYDI